VAPVLTAVDKTLLVLSALGEADSIAGVATVSGLPKSTVHRILQACVRHGFARVTGPGTYAGGRRILSLAGGLLSHGAVAERAAPALHALQGRTGATVHFALLTGDEVVYASKVEPAKPYRMASRVGMAVPLHSTSIGKAVLAAMPEEEARAVLARAGLEPRTCRTWTDPDALVAHLDEVRASGWALDDEENESGVRCVGAAVRDHTGRVTGGVSVSTLTSEDLPLPLPDLGAAVRAAAEEVSDAIGAPSG
jgi:IclR family transcriptional regulator, acetate operon repressor